MKPVYLIGAVVVLAVVLFAVTFALNFLGGPARPPKPATPPGDAAPEARLTFQTKDKDQTVNKYPEDPRAPAAYYPLGKPAHHDFWFSNDSGRDVTVGLQDKTCQCTSAELAIAPEGWNKASDSASPEAAKDLESLVTPTALEKKGKEVVVPAGRVGWVRLTYSSDKPVEKMLGATLWMDKMGEGPTAVFEVRVQFGGPLRVESAAATQGMPLIVVEGPNRAEGLTFDDLPWRFSFLCWSSTRTAFPLKKPVVYSRLKPGADPFVVDDPVPLSASELATLQKERPGLAILSGYHVPIQVLPPSKEGTVTVDLGPFVRFLDLTTEERDPDTHKVAEDTISVKVVGRIQGDLRLVGAVRERIRFGSFDRTEGDARTITVESDAAVTKLEVEERTADFLDVAVADPPESAAGRKTWRIKVQVKPNEASGDFPADDVPRYRDSAVYLKAVYPPLRRPETLTIRVPTEGTANAPP